MVEPAIGDAYGDLLRRCWAMGGAPGAEVVERDDGFVSVGDSGRYFGGAHSWSPCEAAVLPKAHGRVLDIGCGAGRHMIGLRKRGLEVAGIDPSPGAVEVCRERGLDVSVGDIDSLPAGPFDTLLLFGNNLALLGTPRAAPARLAGLAAAAAPGAVILGSNVDPYRNADLPQTEFQARNRQLGRPGGHQRLRVRHAALATDWFDYWFASVEELEQLLADSPWRLDAVERAPKGDPTYAAVLVLR